MRIGLSSVLVDDQEKALVFYTEKLGFLKKTDIPAGEYRWLTVVAPDGDDNKESNAWDRQKTTYCGLTTGLS